jgi:non-specific serine/threonine protein kinase
VPLAIELAAAQTQSHGLRQIHDRLVTGEDLASRSRDVEDRHHSLTAAVAWSYSLLSPELQRFFARLSLFSNDWTAESAEAVCDEPLALDYLTELSECSLVVTTQPVEPNPRYRMLEMIRHFAAEQLDASGDRWSTCERHVQHFNGRSRQVRSNGDRPDAAFWLDLMELDHESFLSALDWRRRLALASRTH